MLAVNQINQQEKTMNKLITGALLALTTMSAGAAEYYSRVDGMTDEDKSYVYISEDSCSRRCASIVLRTGGDVYINTRRYIGDYKYPIEVRFDKGDVTELNYNSDTKGTSLFLHSSDIKNFVGSIKKSNKLLIRTYNYKGTSEIKVFDLSGASLALSKIAEFK